MIDLQPNEEIVDGLIRATSARGEAWFSLDRRYRFMLRRWLRAPCPDDMGRVLAVCMVNPSTADAFINDPTITSLIGRARQLGADTLEVVNLFALRSPDPRALVEAGPEAVSGTDTNDRFIRDAAARGFMVIAAWGANGRLHGRDRRVRADGGPLYGVELHHLGLTKDGLPKHPLARGKHRIPADFVPVRWAP